MTIAHESVMTIENFNKKISKPSTIIASVVTAAATTAAAAAEFIHHHHPEDIIEEELNNTTTNNTPIEKITANDNSSSSSSRGEPSDWTTTLIKESSPSSTSSSSPSSLTTSATASASSPEDDTLVQLLNDTSDSSSLMPDLRVDKVYTIGCFDLFHEGHVILLERMRELGKKVIVGVHDSESIFKLKKRVPVDSTEKRMLNVRALADEVFCIPSCDPSIFMSCIFDLSKGQTALYVRGDDMLDFPSRKLVEQLMPIKFLPYTQGVSSTQIRAEKFAHIVADDKLYLQYNP